MKSLVVHGAGDLRIDDLPELQPAAGQVLVRITHGGICGSRAVQRWRGSLAADEDISARLIVRRLVA